MVLDGAVDPLTDDITSFADQLQGFESAFDQFAAWCRKHSPCTQPRRPARRRSTTIAGQATTSPHPDREPGDTRKATQLARRHRRACRRCTRSRTGRPSATALDRSPSSGDATGPAGAGRPLQRARPTARTRNITDANTTISCNDSKPGPTRRHDPGDRAVVGQAVPDVRPVVGAVAVHLPAVAAATAPCRRCRPRRHSRRRCWSSATCTTRPRRTRARRTWPKTLGNAELLTWNGEGHTSYLQGSSCVDSYVNAYLINGTLPPAEHDVPAK